MRATIIGCTIATATAFLPSRSTPHARHVLGRRICADACIFRRAARAGADTAPRAAGPRPRPRYRTSLRQGRDRPLRPQRVQAARRQVCDRNALDEGAIRPGATLVCASEGNHGRAVARAAREAGCASRVYMAHDAAPSRVAAIAGEGAEVVKVDGSYDDAVRIMQADAAEPVDGRVGHGVGRL